MDTYSLGSVADEQRDGTADQPARSGQPWTEEDYQQLVALVRDGAAEPALAEALQRSPTTVVPRLRRLLPVAERRCLADRVLVTAREHLADPDYDWRSVMLQSEPPRPFHYPPPVARGGVGGLPDRDLVTVGYALLATFRDRELEIVREVAAEIEHRGVLHRLVEQRVQTLLHRPGGSSLTEAEARDVAERWVLESSAWTGTDGPGPWAGGRYGASPYDGVPWAGVADYDGSVGIR